MHAMDCLEQNLQNQIYGGDSVLSTTFCRDQIWTLRVCSMTHYDITIGNDVARDVHCDIILGHDVDMAHIMMLQYILMLLGPLFMYYYTQF